MEEEKIKHLLKEIEGQKLEHKSKDYLESSTKEIAKDISSFMNKDGGKILIGVKNNEPDGLIFNQKDEERIMNICKDLLRPPQFVDLDICEFKEGTIIILDIVPSREPVQANKKYFYIRHGSTTRHMTPEEINRKIIESEHFLNLINVKDADKILSEKQNNRDIIVDKNGIRKTYIELNSGELTGNSNKRICIVYGTFYGFLMKTVV